MQKYDLTKPLIGGGFFVSREWFNNELKKNPNAPQDYSYDEYVADSTETKDEAYEREKTEWIEANPTATPEQYTSAMREIAEGLGV